MKSEEEVKLIAEFVKNEGESKWNDRIGHDCVTAINVTEYLDTPDDNWLRLKNEGIWDGHQQTDEVVKFIFIDSNDKVMVLGMDSKSFKRCYECDVEVFDYEPYGLDEFTDETIHEICKKFELFEN